MKEGRKKKEYPVVYSGSDGRELASAGKLVHDITSLPPLSLSSFQVGSRKSKKKKQVRVWRAATAALGRHAPPSKIKKERKEGKEFRHLFSSFQLAVKLSGKTSFSFILYF